MEMKVKIQPVYMMKYFLNQDWVVLFCTVDAWEPGLHGPGLFFPPEFVSFFTTLLR